MASSDGIVPMAKKPCDACERRFLRQPQDYLRWHEWAERQSKRYEQAQCQNCGRWTVWKRKAKSGV